MCFSMMDDKMLTFLSAITSGFFDTVVRSGGLTLSLYNVLTSPCDDS